MDELVKRLSENLGIPEEDARKAILITADHLKRKLPDPVYRQLEIALKMPEASEEEIKELGLFRFP
jgi:hypothetical protein